MQLPQLKGLIYNEMTFGKKLAEQRKRQNLSQEELAKLVGIHANVMGRYERDLAKPSI